MNNKRFRTIGLILYPENQNHKLALDYIIHNFENYIYILHDRDIKDDTGEIKKEHYHILLHFSNARTIKSLSKKINVEENLFYQIKSFTGQLRYLIHYDDDEKTRYDVDEVKGTLFMLSKFKKSIRGSQDETADVSQIYEFIYNNDVSDLHLLLDFVLDNNLYSSFRRNYSMFKDLLALNSRKVVYYDKNKKNR